MQGHGPSSHIEPLPVLRAAEFFAGIGLAGIGMSGANISTVWANDLSRSKFDMYSAHFGSKADRIYHVGDLKDIRASDVPPDIDIAWASFPCTDLSPAGTRAGLRGTASSAFWHFIKVLSGMKQNRPSVIVIENVVAFAKSHDGKDLESAVTALNGLGYSVDALVLDAANFLPQSRPRLFLVGCLDPGPSDRQTHAARPAWLTDVLSRMGARLHQRALPPLPPRSHLPFAAMAEVIPPDDPRWWPADRVVAYLSSLTPAQTERMEKLRDAKTTSVRTAYRRMRQNVPRWEMRNDPIAGCLRASKGGSSRQAVVYHGHKRVNIRWMTTREYALLMGAPGYRSASIPDAASYSGFGDAVCVPVVEWLAQNYIRPVAASREATASQSVEATVRNNAVAS